MCGVACSISPLHVLDRSLLPPRCNDCDDDLLTCPCLAQTSVLVDLLATCVGSSRLKPAHSLGASLGTQAYELDRPVHVCLLSAWNQHLFPAFWAEPPEIISWCHRAPCRCLRPSLRSSRRSDPRCSLGTQTASTQQTCPHESVHLGSIARPRHWLWGTAVAVHRHWHVCHSIKTVTLSNLHLICHSVKVLTEYQSPSSRTLSGWLVLAFRPSWRIYTR